MVVKYSDMIQTISEATGLSHHRVRLLMKACSEVYQEAIFEGKDIDCGLFKIGYTLPKGSIYKNKEVDWAGMEREVYSITGIDYGIVKIVLTQYKSLLTSNVLNGNAVTIKGIGYLYPEEFEDGSTDIRYRISPSLLKCEEAEFVAMKDGKMTIQTLTSDDVRLSMSVNLLSKA